MNIKDKLWYQILHTKLTVDANDPKFFRVDCVQEVGSWLKVPKVLKLFSWRAYVVSTYDRKSEVNLVKRYFVISDSKIEEDRVYLYTDFPGTLNLGENWTVAVVTAHIQKPVKVMRRTLSATGKPDGYRCAGSFWTKEEARFFIKDNNLDWRKDDYDHIRTYKQGSRKAERWGDDSKVIYDLGN